MIEPKIEGLLGADHGELDFDAVEITAWDLLWGKKFLVFVGEADGGDFLLRELLQGC